MGRHLATTLRWKSEENEMENTRRWERRVGDWCAIETVALACIYCIIGMEHHGRTVGLFSVQCRGFKVFEKHAAGLQMPDYMERKYSHVPLFTYGIIRSGQLITGK